MIICPLPQHSNCWWHLSCWYEHIRVMQLNVFSRFEIHRIFSRTRRRIQTSGLHDQHHMSTPTGHRNKQLNKCALPLAHFIAQENCMRILLRIFLKGPQIILDMADRHINKDGPFLNYRQCAYIFTFELLRYHFSSFFIIDMLTYD